MAEMQKKIELLQKIAHRFNEANIEWALGASMLLYFKGIISEFHDIDLMVSVHDADRSGLFYQKWENFTHRLLLLIQCIVQRYSWNSPLILLILMLWLDFLL